MLTFGASGTSHLTSIKLTAARSRCCPHWTHRSLHKALLGLKIEVDCGQAKSRVAVQGRKSEVTLRSQGQAPEVLRRP